MHGASTVTLQACLLCIQFQVAIEFIPQLAETHSIAIPDWRADTNYTVYKSELSRPLNHTYRRRIDER